MIDLLEDKKAINVINEIIRDRKSAEVKVEGHGDNQRIVVVKLSRVVEYPPKQ